MTQPRNPFTRSGALRPNHPLFRGRAAELDRLEQACLADLDFFLLVYGGRQNGKTTMLLQLEERLRARLSEGVRVCQVDFQSLPRANAHDTYRYLARSVARALPQMPQSPELLDAPTLIDFLEAALDGSAVQHLVLLLDELGTLPDTTRKDLAHVLRALHTRRLSSPALAKAQFVLVGGIELYNLAVVEASALRNVCEIMQLGDLGEADAVNLIADGLARVGITQSVGVTLGQAIYARVHGHPYFTQRIGEWLASQPLTNISSDDTIVERFSWEILRQSDSLLEHLRRSIGELKLEDAARRLLSTSQLSSHIDDQIERLELLGVAHRAGEHWAPRSPLMSVALAEWLHPGMPRTGPLITTAQAARKMAIERYLSDLKREQTTIDQIYTQQRASELSAEIRRLEALLIEISQPIPKAGKSTEPTAPKEHFLPPGPKPSPNDWRRATWLPELVRIPSGTFLMGSSDSDYGAKEDEKPQHSLPLPDYWIGKTPVTNGQFRPFVEGDGYRNRRYWTTAGWQWREEEQIFTPNTWGDKKVGDEYPVVGVSWFEAVAYCRWLTAQTGHPFRLPSEAEWEKAARGPDGRIWPWGNTWDQNRCNSEEASISRTTPVSRYPEGASYYDILDLAGNAWEWVASQWRKPYPYQLEDEWREAYLEGDVTRVLRGGSRYNQQKLVRGAYRYYYFSRYRDINIGLRIASSAPQAVI